MHFDGLYVEPAATAFRLEGFAPSVKHRKDALVALLRPFGTMEGIDDGEFAETLARRPRRRAVLIVNGSVGEWPLWRVSTTPARGAEFARKLPPGAQFYYDWAGGLIWIALPPFAQCGRRHHPPRRRLDRRSCHSRSRAAPQPAPRSMCSSRSRAHSPASPGASRKASIPRACSIPAACGRAFDADQLLAHPACRSGHRGGRQDSARLRALRLLPGDMPDLRAARRRARFAARPHLPDQGDAGARSRLRPRRSSRTSTAACRAWPA